MDTAPYPTAPPPSAEVLDAGVVRVLGQGRSDGAVDGERALALHAEMVRARVLDRLLVELQREGKVGFHSSAQGEEAAILGAAAALRPNDWIFPTPREYPAALFRGVPLAAYLHHMFGDAEDPMKGRPMPDHLGLRAARVAQPSSVVGAHIIHAAGFAWAARIRKEDSVTLAYFGDGATSTGDFHNGLNFAGVFRAPVVFFCRNNGWALSLPTKRQTASATLGVKAVGYGMPFVRVDGNDLFAVMEVVSAAVLRAAAGEGPTLIEALTDVAPAKDPIARTKRHLIDRGLLSESTQLDLELKTDREMRDAIAAASLAPRPAVSTLFDDVYAELPAALREQRASFPR